MLKFNMMLFLVTGNNCKFSVPGTSMCYNIYLNKIHWHRIWTHNITQLAYRTIQNGTGNKLWDGNS